MVIKEIIDDKMLYMDLLLLADEQEDMIHRYLEKGTMYVLDDNGVKAECIVTDERNGILVWLLLSHTLKECVIAH